MKTKLFAWASWIAFLMSAVSEWGFDLDLPLTPALWLTIIAVTFFATAARGALATNSWIATINDVWQNDVRWSLGVAPSNDQTAVLITNDVTKTITLNSATPAGNRTISNLTVRGVGPAVNTLQLTNMGAATPLLILDTFSLGSNATLRVTNSVLNVGTLNIDGSVTNLAGGQILADGITFTISNLGNGNFASVDGSLQAGIITIPLLGNHSSTMTLIRGTNTVLTRLTIGSSIRATGAVWVTNGDLVMTNATAEIGRAGIGQLTLSNSLWEQKLADIAVIAGSQGTLTIVGGTNNLFGLTVGDAGTGAVWVSASQLITTNGTVVVGDGGIGQMTVSNAQWQAPNVTVGGFATGEGTLTLAGGTNTLAAAMIVGSPPGARGTVWVTGNARLVATNLITRIGNSGIGQMIVSNGTVLTDELRVADQTGSQGTLTVAGGTNTLSSVLAVAEFSNSTGTIWMTGGRLVVTNATTFIGVSGLGQMTVSNGHWLAATVNVGANAGSQGTLTINGGTNAIVGPLTIGNGTGAVWITGGTLVITNDPENVTSGVGFIIDGSATLNSGMITVSNSAVVGSHGAGSLKVNNGSLSVSNLLLGTSAGANGTLTLSGGTNSFRSTLGVANNLGSTGTVWLTGGQLGATNGGLSIGVNGVGRMIVSNGTMMVSNVILAVTSNGSGTLTVAGGTNQFSSFAIGNFATGAVWMTSSTAQLTVTNGSITIGNFGRGQMTVSNGTWAMRDLSVGINGGSHGTLTVNGGAGSVFSNLTIGNFACTATGSVKVAGGELNVTNALGNAVLEVRSGTFTLNSGAVRVDKFVMTNACANFVRTGGTLIYSNAVLIGTRDDDGDGIPNAFDLDPLNPADAGNDPDGDGFTNLQEFQAGTSPTNSASAFRITSIAREANNVRVTWMTGIGRTNALDRSAGDPSGNFTTNYVSIFTVTNTVGKATNYLDLGAATNTPAFYYRVRLVP